MKNQNNSQNRKDQCPTNSTQNNNQKQNPQNKKPSSGAQNKQEPTSQF